MGWQIKAGGICLSTQLTLQCEAVVFHPIWHIFPHNILHVLQGLRCQGYVKTSSLQGRTTNHQQCCLRKSEHFLSLSLRCSLSSCVRKQPLLSIIWRSIKMPQQFEHKVLKKTALTWKKLSSLSFRMPSLSRSDILKMRVSALMQDGFIWRINRKKLITTKHNRSFKFFEVGIQPTNVLLCNTKGPDYQVQQSNEVLNLLPLSLLESTKVLLGAEQPSGRSRTTLRYSSGFWLNTKKEQ